MKLAVHITLLALWVCVLAVPSLVTVLNQGEKPVIVLNLNEEEPQEQGKTDAEEKQTICNSLLTHSHAKAHRGANGYCHFLLLLGGLPQEILLPPPEPLS